ncbi:MAG: BlaI/MecI/CopY family transcriptional regulator [Deltaproteobacteria bacterium]|nr:BlaI/MecI/CopY family transcriptional regulator [Deltaproteobacteria bacterium]
MISDPLSRRERQIMDVVFKLGRATAADVQGALEDPPSYSAVRAQLRILEDKGHLRHRQDGQTYVYEPLRSKESKTKTELRRLLDTFFAGSTRRAISALVDLSDGELDDDERVRLKKLIDSKKNGK